MENNEEVKVTAEQPEVVENTVDTPKNDNKDRRGGKFDRNKKFGKRDDKRRRDDRKPRDEMESRVVSRRRVSKSVKGGDIPTFSVLVVVGDRKGKVGVGRGKSREQSEAVEKAIKNAKKNLVTIAMEGTTIPHATKGRFGTSQIILLPAKDGNGIIAGGAARAVVELAGIRDITTKLHGSSNKENCVKATLEALMSLKTLDEVNKLRGKNQNKVEEN